MKTLARIYRRGGESPLDRFLFWWAMAAATVGIAHVIVKVATTGVW